MGLIRSTASIAGASILLAAIFSLFFIPLTLAPSIALFTFSLLFGWVVVGARIKRELRSPQKSSKRLWMLGLGVIAYLGVAYVAGLFSPPFRPGAQNELFFPFIFTIGVVAGLIGP